MLVSYEYDSKVYPSDNAAANKRQAMQLKTRKCQEKGSDRGQYQK